MTGWVPTAERIVSEGSGGLSHVSAAWITCRPTVSLIHSIGSSLHARTSTLCEPIRVAAQLVQIAGAIAILIGFVAAQVGVFDVRSWTYLWLNAVGAGILTAAAWSERQWGFLLLEGVWTLVALGGLVQKTRRRSQAT